MNLKNNILGIPPLKIAMLIAVLHMSLWFIIPLFTFETVSLDSVEMTAWGRNLDWGFYKHPPMPAVILNILNNFFSTNISVFLASQLLIATSLLGIYVFARNYMSKDKIAIALSLTLLIAYLNWEMPYFNHNPVQLPFWIWTVVIADFAIRTNKVKYWLVFGVVAGVSLYTKYNIAILYITLLLFVVIYKRHCINIKNILAFGTMFTIIVMPHIFWLFDNDFITLTYASHQSREGFSLSNLGIFILVQILTNILVILGLLLSRYKADNYETESNDFLTFVVFVPFIIVALVAFINDMWLKPNWGFVMVAFIPLWLVGLINKINMKIIFSWVTAWVIIIASIYGYHYQNKQDRGDFPAQNIANEIQIIWHNNTGAKLSYVAGSQWIAGVVSAYATDKPKLIVNNNIKINSWVDKDDLDKSGFVYIWNNSETVPDVVFNKMGKISVPYIEPYQSRIEHLNWGIVLPK